MKTKLSFLMLMALAVWLTSCNQELGTNVSGQDDFSTPQFKIEPGTDPANFKYSIYLPDVWCKVAVQDSTRPWIMSFINGQAYLNEYVGNSDPGYLDYYVDRWEFPSNQKVSVLLNFGNYINGNDINNARTASIVGHKYAVLYQPTYNRSDDVYLLGFTLYNGGISSLENPNQLIPLDGDIAISGSMKLGEQIFFSVSNLQYTGLVGLKDNDGLSWLFDDGVARNGTSFNRDFKTIGSHTVTLTITDNLGKSIKINKSFTIN